MSQHSYPIESPIQQSPNRSLPPADFSKLFRESPFIKKLNQINTLTDRRLGRVRKLQDKLLTNYYYQKEVLFTDKEDALPYLNQILKRFDYPNPAYQNIIDYQFFERQEMCASFSYLSYLIIQPRFSLSADLEKRMVAQRPLDNEELTYLLYDTVEALGNLHEHGLSHQVLSPEWVLLDEERPRRFRLMDNPLLETNDPPLLFMSENRFQQKVEGRNQLKGVEDGDDVLNSEFGVKMRNRSDGADLQRLQCSYKSPEEFQRQIKDQLVIEYDKSKSDVFSLGLVILRAGVLEHITGIYDIVLQTFNEYELNRLMHKFKEYYADNILVCSTLERMLKINPNHRPTLLEVKERLPLSEHIEEHFRQERLNNPPWAGRASSVIKKSTRLSLKPRNQSQSKLSFEPKKSQRMMKNYEFNEQVYQSQETQYPFQENKRVRTTSITPYPKAYPNIRIDAETMKQLLPVTTNHEERHLSAAQYPSGKPSAAEQRTTRHSSGFRVDDGVPENWVKVGPELYKSPSGIVYQRVLIEKIEEDPVTGLKSIQKRIKFTPVNDVTMQPNPESKSQVLGQQMPLTFQNNGPAFQQQEGTNVASQGNQGDQSRDEELRGSGFKKRPQDRQIKSERDMQYFNGDRGNQPQNQHGNQPQNQHGNQQGDQQQNHQANPQGNQQRSEEKRKSRFPKVDLFLDKPPSNLDQEDDYLKDPSTFMINRAHFQPDQANQALQNQGPNNTDDNQRNQNNRQNDDFQDLNQDQNNVSRRDRNRNQENQIQNHQNQQNKQNNDPQNTGHHQGDNYEHYYPNNQSPNITTNYNPNNIPNTGTNDTLNFNIRNQPQDYTQNSSSNQQQVSPQRSPQNNSDNNDRNRSNNDYNNQNNQNSFPTDMDSFSINGPTAFQGRGSRQGLSDERKTMKKPQRQPSAARNQDQDLRDTQGDYDESGDQNQRNYQGNQGNQGNLVNYSETQRNYNENQRNNQRNQRDYDEDEMNYQQNQRSTYRNYQGQQDRDYQGQQGGRTQKTDLSTISEKSNPLFNKSYEVTQQSQIQRKFDIVQEGRQVSQERGKNRNDGFNEKDYSIFSDNED